jgi:hypothetical protein
MDTTESSSPSLYEFAKAVHSLREAFAQPKNDVTRDATVYRFVYTFELALNALCRHLGTAGVAQDISVTGPFWLAEQHGIFTESDAEAWSSYFQAWRRATHSHDAVHVEALYHMIVPEFLEYAQALLDTIVDRRGPRGH